MKLAIAAGIAALVLSGCATRWSKPGGSDSEFYSDRYQCEQQAAASYPAVMVQNANPYQPAPVTNTATNCYVVSGIMQCQSTQSAVTPRWTPPPQAIDANAQQRFDATRSCLMARGYRPMR